MFEFINRAVRVRRRGQTWEGDVWEEHFAIVPVPKLLTFKPCIDQQRAFPPEGFLAVVKSQGVHHPVLVQIVDGHVRPRYVRQEEPSKAVFRQENSVMIVQPTSVVNTFHNRGQDMRRETIGRQDIHHPQCVPGRGGDVHVQQGTIEQGNVRRVGGVVILHMVHAPIGDGDEGVETTVLRVPPKQQQFAADGVRHALRRQSRHEGRVVRQTRNVTMVDGPETRERDERFAVGNGKQLVNPLQNFHRGVCVCVGRRHGGTIKK